MARKTTSKASSSEEFSLGTVIELAHALHANKHADTWVEMGDEGRRASWEEESAVFHTQARRILRRMESKGYELVKKG